MKILVDRVTDTPTRHEFAATADWWRHWTQGAADVADAIGEPVACRVDVHRMGEDLFLDGALEGEIQLECGRCLARYRAPIREPFRMLLEPAGARVPADPETAGALARDGVCLSDELESGWFQGSEIDLSALFHEVIALGLPVQPLCREDCKGLCPRCGVDRNETTCECVETNPASPFAVLQALRGGTEGETR